MKLKERQFRKLHYDRQKLQGRSQVRVPMEALDYDSDFIATMMQEASADSTGFSRMSRALRNVIDNELTPRQQEVIRMRYFNGMKDIQIAEALGVSASTVCRTRARAENRIRRMLQYCLPFIRAGIKED